MSYRFTLSARKGHQHPGYGRSDSASLKADTRRQLPIFSTCATGATTTSRPLAEATPPSKAELPRAPLVRRPTSAGCWSRTQPITPLFAIRITGRRFVLARSTTVGIENPFGSTVVLDPRPNRGRAPNSDTAAGAILQRRRQLSSRFRVESGGAARSAYRISARRERAIPQQS